jgi:hypothetical protein
VRGAGRAAREELRRWEAQIDGAPALRWSRFGEGWRCSPARSGLVLSCSVRGWRRGCGMAVGRCGGGELAEQPVLAERTAGHPPCVPPPRAEVAASSVGASPPSACRREARGGAREGDPLLPPAAPSSSPSQAAVGTTRTEAVGARAPCHLAFLVSPRILWIPRNREATGFSRAPAGTPLQASKCEKPPAGGDRRILAAPVRVVLWRIIGAWAHQRNEKMEGK